MAFRGPLIAVAALAASLLAPRGAAAAINFVPCGKGAVECGTVNVPLDRSGATPGTISLYVERLPAGGTPRGTLFLIAGGPGQASARTFDLASQGAFFRDQFPGYTLVAFDPRGTGRSGLLRCPEFQNDPAASPARAQALVATCANEIGPTRSFYSTRDHADDIDAVRQALGIDKVALWGTSYGTQLSVAYAYTYPQHVERLLLDSVADPLGRDPFSTDDLREMPKGLAALCNSGSCRTATPNFVREVASIANRLAARSLEGRVPRPSGGSRVVRASGLDLLSGAVLDSDLNPGLAAELPAAVHAALRGQPRTLLRLVELDRESALLPAEDLSLGLFAATVCDDGPFPWSPSTPVAQRKALYDSALAALPAGATGPFGRWAVGIGPAEMCLRWPAQPARPGIGSGPLPNVPALVLAGDRDLRTPAAHAADVAARFPQGRLLIAPGVGHSVLGADLSSCAEKAVKTWLAGGVPPSRCTRSPLLVQQVARFPASVAAAARVGGVGGLRGRTLGAVATTLREAAATWAVGFQGFEQVPPALAGPYGGRLRIAGVSFSLAGYSAVPGLRVSGTLRVARNSSGAVTFPLRFTGSVRVAGAKAAHGRLKVGRAALTGRLGGRGVRGPT
jgi:pimeloyl-ACP methyl ester carboxylesterase